MMSGDGRDTLIGNGGDDYMQMTGYVAGDSVDGGTGEDFLALSRNSAVNLVFDMSDGGGGRDVGDGTFIAGIEVLAVVTGSGNDRIVTGSGDDSVSSGAGNDFVSDTGGFGAFDGGAGRDTFSFVGAVGDVRLATYEGVLTIYLGGVDSPVEGFEVFLTGAGNDSLLGSDVGETLTSGAGNDTLNGGGGRDVLNGGDGADRLMCSLGADVLAGGAGRDVYVLTEIQHSTGAGEIDRIRGFQQGQDKIDLSGIDAKAGGLANDAFKFRGSQAFSGNEGELRFEATLSSTTVEGDVDGDGVADFTLELSGLYALLAKDFVL